MRSSRLRRPNRMPIESNFETNATFGPNFCVIWSTRAFMPVRTEPTAMIVIVPTTTPRSVSAERTLFAQMVPSASARFSRMACPGRMSVRPQRRDRVELRRLHRRVDPKEETDARRERHGEDRPEDRQRRGDRQDHRNTLHGDECEDHSDEAAAARQNDRLDEK